MRTNTKLLFLLLLAFSISCTDEGLNASYVNASQKSSTGSRPAVPVTNGQIQIGTQIWATKNLNVSRYRNGDIIPEVTNDAAWQQLTTGAWRYYENNTAYGPVYGKIYNWYAVNDPRGLAPQGWHVGSDAEWTTLTNFLGGLPVAGKAIKSTTLWSEFADEGTNSSGFTGLPGGICTDNGVFANLTYGAVWWTSTAFDNYEARYRSISFTSDAVVRNLHTKIYGSYVRCVRD